MKDIGLNLIPVRHYEIPENYFSTKKCLVIASDIATVTMLDEMGIQATVHVSTNDKSINDHILLADFVLLTGGTDISPAIYHQERGDHTETPNSVRDVLEVAIIKQCIKTGVPVIGICRGAQLLSSVLGGRLRQHDDTKEHLNSHPIETKDGYSLGDCYANHHQLIIPPPTSKVIGTWNGVNEIIYHPAVGLSVQYHPEWHSPHETPFKYFMRLIHDTIEDVL